MFRKISFNTITTIDETGRIQLGSLLPEEAYEILKDGRVSGLILERMICRWFFPYVTKVLSEGGNWDLELEGGRRIETRTVTKGGVHLIPSHQLGSGRAYDEEGFKDKLSNIAGYCFVDVTDSPRFSVIFVSKNDLPLDKKGMTKRHLSYANYEKFVKSLKK